MKGKDVCNRGGDCCDPLFANWTKKQVRAVKGVVPSRECVLKHWRRISRKEAIRRRPALEGLGQGMYFYECDQFDSVTRLCKDHENRPPICSRFPKYSDEKVSESILRYLPRCSYREKESGA